MQWHLVISHGLISLTGALNITHHTAKDSTFSYFQARCFSFDCYKCIVTFWWKYLRQTWLYYSVSIGTSNDPTFVQISNKQSKYVGMKMWRVASSGDYGALSVEDRKKTWEPLVIDKERNEVVMTIAVWQAQKNEEKQTKIKRNKGDFLLS